LRVVFSQSRNFTIIAFTDATVYATSMQNRRKKVFNWGVWHYKINQNSTCL